MIDSYLRGRADQSDQAIHLLFSANRWEAVQGILNDLASGTTVVIDRYSFSGAVYSAAKENPLLSLEWAWNPEIGLPQPDLVLFLDISSENAARRGGYGEERYEKEAMQQKVRTLFKQLFGVLAKTTLNVQIIDAGGSLDEVENLIWKVYKQLEQQREDFGTQELLNLPAL